MKRFIWAACVVILAVPAAFGRDPQEVLDIRARYQAVDDKIAAGGLYLVEVVCNATDVPMPGTGHSVRTIRFYYGIDESSGEPTGTLVKIEVVEEIAAMELNREFLLGTDGKLLFCYDVVDNVYDDEPPTLELRLYYRGGTLFRAVEGATLLNADFLPEEYRRTVKDLSDELNALVKLSKFLH